MQVNIFDFADKVIEKLEGEHEFVFSELRRNLNAENDNNISGLFSDVVRQLERDGYIDEKGGRAIFRITGPGQEFIRKGGYKNKREEERIAKKLAEDQIRSTIDTNNSVIGTNRISKHSMIFSTIISAVSLFFIIMTFIKDDQGQLLQLKQQSQEMRLEVAALQRSLSQIDTSLRYLRTLEKK